MDDITISLEEMKLIEQALTDKAYNLTLEGYTAYAQQHRSLRDKVSMLIALHDESQKNGGITS